MSGGCLPLDGETDRRISLALRNVSRGGAERSEESLHQTRASGKIVDMVFARMARRQANRLFL
jgi:hypothetical protein